MAITINLPQIGTDPAGLTTEIQYNNAGAFGADSGFTRDPSTGAFNVSHNTNDTSIMVGDGLAGGLVNGAIVQSLGGTKIIGLQIGKNLVTDLFTAGNSVIDSISGELVSIEANSSGVAAVQYIDNIFTPTISSVIEASAINTKMQYSEVGVAQNSVTIDSLGVKISSATDSYTLPLVDGTAGQVLSTDGNGVLSWVTP